MSDDPNNDLKQGEGLVFSAVVAMAPGRVIGKDGGMPWHISDDLKLFRKLTTGHPIVMGRKTYDSLGNPLPNRQNIVLTRDQSWQADGVQRISGIEDLYSLALIDREVCVIGGAQVYDLMMPVIDLLWVSKIHREYEGDTCFPEFESKFPFSRKMLAYPDFDLWLYTKEAELLDSAYANRVEA